MRAEGTVSYGGSWGGSHVPLPTAPRPNRQRPERAPVIVLQPLTRAEERALERRSEKLLQKPRRKPPKPKMHRERYGIHGDELTAVVAAYEAGDSLSVLVRTTGHAKETIRGALIRAGVTIRAQGGSSTRLTPTEEQQIVDTYRRVGNIQDAAAACHRHTQTVSACLDRAGITDHHTHRGGAKPLDDGAVRKLWDQGLTMKSIAERLDCSPSGVKYALRRLGVTDTGRNKGAAGTRGADNPSARAKARLEAAGATFAEVRGWARDTGRPCTSRGMPPAALVHEYLRKLGAS